MTGAEKSMAGNLIKLQNKTSHKKLFYIVSRHLFASCQVVSGSFISWQYLAGSFDLPRLIQTVHHQVREVILVIKVSYHVKRQTHLDLSKIGGNYCL